MSTSSPPPEGPGGPEYLEHGGGDPVAPSSSPRGRRTAVLAGGAAVLLAAAGAGTWAAVSFFSGGSQAAEALPSGTLAYASVDLDPSGAQKIAAFRMLDKFPAFREELGLDADDDIRRRIFEEGIGQECEGVSYADDVEPWLGTSFTVAAVEAGEEQPSPVLVVGITDAGAADEGLAALAKCTGEEQAGWAVAGDWAYLAETDAIAESVVDRLAEGSLADSSDHEDQLAQVGEQGVATFYAAPAAGQAIAELIPELGGMGSAPEADDELSSLLAEFGGGAATLRFADGGVELEAALDLPQGNVMPLMPVAEDGTLEIVETLPADTALAYGAVLPQDWAQGFVDQMTSYGIPEQELERGLAEAEAQTGLSLPEDLETLLGEQVAFAVGGEVDLEELFMSGDPSTAPVGVRVQGDPEGVNRVLDKLATASGLPQWFETETEGDLVAWSPNPDYRSRLVAQGSLGDSETYRGVVTESDRAAGVLFVDFDAGDWLTSLAEGDQEAQANLEPLDALGMSTWIDDGTTHQLVRLTTD